MSTLGALVAGAGPVDQASLHRVHLVMLLAVWAATLLAHQVHHQRRQPRPARDGSAHLSPPGSNSPVVVVVAGAAAGAGLVHLLVTPKHFEEGTAYGVFFLLLGTAQIIWGAALLRLPKRGLLRLGGGWSASVVLLWFNTRFIGIGLGPLESGRESLGVLDTAATGAELLVVVVAALGTRVIPDADEVVSPTAANECDLDSWGDASNV